jgi:hypothetical protein
VKSLGDRGAERGGEDAPDAEPDDRPDDDAAHAYRYLRHRERPPLPTRPTAISDGEIRIPAGVSTWYRPSKPDQIVPRAVWSLSDDAAAAGNMRRTFGAGRSHGTPTRQTGVTGPSSPALHEYHDRDDEHALRVRPPLDSTSIRPPAPRRARAPEG